MGLVWYWLWGEPEYPRSKTNNESFCWWVCFSPLLCWHVFSFPRKFLENIIILETNNHLDKRLPLGEFLRWIGTFFFLSTFSRFIKISFWPNREVSREDGAPYRFHDLMNRSWFEDILLAIQYTDKEPPLYWDCFWEVWQMINAWNENMVENFSPSWVSCLDNSMFIWFKKFTCPGWIFCFRKPHLFGNDCHSICCRLSGIMYSIESREGKDAPTQKEVDPEERMKGNTAYLLLQLTKALYATGKVVILDSDFCVLQAIVALQGMRVFAGALIKKSVLAKVDWQWYYWQEYGGLWTYGVLIEKHGQLESG